MSIFTAAELEELRRADAEIDAEFVQTAEEIAESRARDRDARLAALPDAKRKRAERQRAYYEANRDKAAEYKRAYYYNRTPNEAFRSWMQETGTTQKALAEKIGVTQATISTWYTGSAPINMQKLRAALPELADYLEGAQ